MQAAPGCEELIRSLAGGSRQPPVPKIGGLAYIPLAQSVATAVELRRVP